MATPIVTFEPSGVQSAMSVQTSCRLVRTLSGHLRNEWRRGFSLRAAATLEEKRSKALEGGGEKRIAKQHKTVRNPWVVFLSALMLCSIGEVDSQRAY